VGPRAGLDGRKILPPPGFHPRTVQPVASRYTDYATRPTYYSESNGNLLPTFRDNLAVSSSGVKNLTSGDGIDRLSRNVSKVLELIAE
jgi:hypothetical protein